MQTMHMTVDTLVWMTVGIALLSAEAFTGTFHLMFFGVSALITALFTAMGLNSTVLQVISFALFSLCSVIILRNRLSIQSHGFSADENREFQLEDDLPPGSETTIRYHGVPWTAVNTSKSTLQSGEWARVVRTEGIKLIVEPIPPKKK